MKKQVLCVLLLFWCQFAFSQCDPANLAVSNISSSEVTLSWNAPSAASFKVKWRVSGSTSSWNGTDPNVMQTPSLLTVDSLFLDTLLPNTTYDWRIRPFGCNPSANWWDGTSFTTLSSCNLSSSINVTNASCDNSLDGGIDLTIVGGTAPFTYSWSNGLTSEDLVAVSHGVYIVTITDAAGCSLIDTATINFIGNKSVSQLVTSFIDTSNLNLSGVIERLKWAFDTLTIINTGCEVNIRPEFIISHDSLPIQQGDFVLKWYNPITGTWPNIPYGINNNGDAFGYWGMPASDSTGTILNLGATQQMILKVKFYNSAKYGTYSAAWETFEVDNLGNKMQSLSSADSIQVRLINCTNFSIDSVSSITTSCNSVNDGSASVISITNGSASYSYFWNDGQTNATAANLSSGSYTITVTDNSWGCIDSANVIISEPAVFTHSLSSTNNTCGNTCSGSISINLNGGTLPYSYNWNTNDSTASIQNVCGGTYIVTSTDANTCNTFTDTIVIDSTTTIGFSISTSSNNINCYGFTDGNATVTVSASGTGGGTVSYCTSGPSLTSYSNIENVRLIGDNDSISNNTIGICDTYQNYLSQSTRLSVGQSYNLQVNLGTCHPTFAFIDVAKVFVDWNIDGDFDDAGEMIQLISPTQSPSINTFSFTVPSSATAGNTRMRIVSQSYAYNNSSILFTACDSTVLVGATEDYTLSIDAGTPATFLWSTGDTTAQISNLSTGTYIVTVSDTNNCSLHDTVTIDEPVAISVSATTTDVSCNGGNDGIANLTLSGGTGTLSANWGTLTPSALPAGTHTYTITDSNSCVFSDSVTINQPTAITASATTTDVSCNGGNDGFVTLYISGGITDYIVTAFGFTLPLIGGVDTVASSSIFPTGVPAGIYPFVISDSNNCSIADTVIINQPAPLNAAFSANNLTACGLTDGSIDVSTSGGTPPYIYNWSNGDSTEDISNLSSGQYILNVIDSNGCSFTDTIIITQPSNNLILTASVSNYNGYDISCNGGIDSVTAFVSGGTPGYTFLWSDGQTSPTAKNLIAGSYSVTVTDTNSCDYTISVNLTEPPVLSNNISSSNVLCYGSSDGSISINVSGAVLGYTTNWGGITNPSAVAVGNYTITTTDSNNCVAIDSVEITQPNILSGSILITSNYNGEDISCYGYSDGSLIANIMGGVLPYTYNWSSGGNTNIEDSLTSGNYSLTIIDSNNCATNLNTTLNEPSALQITTTAIDVSCNGNCNGIISTNVSGGTLPYAYNWSNNDTTSMADSLCAGNYYLTLTDINGCMHYDSASIIEPTPLIINSDSIIAVSYFGTNTGFIYASVSGGNSGYSYSWVGPNGFIANTEDLDSLFAGTYTLTISDSLGCVSSMQFIVDGPAGYPLIVQVDSVVDVSCNGFCDGEIFITAEGGDSTYFYSWTSSNGYTSSLKDINGLCPGIYDLELTDSSGNIFNISYQIAEPNPLSISITTDSALCYAGTGLANVYPLGGTPNYTYIWSSGDSNQTANLPAGNYTVLVKDVNDCFLSDSLTIFEADSLVVSAAATDATCFGLSNGLVTINISAGGQAPFSYSNDNGSSFQASNTFFNLAIGTYDLVIMDANNCIASISDSISQPQELTFSINTTDVSCYGYCDGTATLSISGGTPFYTEDWGGLNQMALCEGLLNISVTDSNGCIASNSAIINEPLPVVVNISQNGNILDAGAGFISYQWLDDNLNPISGATAQQFIPTASGEYAVMVTDSNGCKATSFLIMFIADAVIEANTILNIYPNPTKNKLNIQYQGFSINAVKIMDVYGNLVRRETDLNINESVLQISLYPLSKGMYVVQLISDEKVINHTVILQ